jgi:hypothetical protein
LSENPDIVASAVNPLFHFANSGGKEGRRPHPLFQTDWYLREYPDVTKSGVNPLYDYLTAGANKQRNPNPLFDSEWYLSQYPEVAAAGVNPLIHYATRGAYEGCNPSPFFDSKSYLAAHPGLAENRINPLSHVLVFGKANEVAAARERHARTAVGVDDPAQPRTAPGHEDARLARPVLETSPPTAAPKTLLLAFGEDRATLDGLKDFLRFVWRSVRRAIPEAELIIAGNTAGSVRAIDPRIKIVAELDAIDSLFGQARIAVNPSVAGDRLNTLAALAHYRTVVGWPGSVAGISPALLPFCNVVRNWVEFAERTILLLTSGQVPLASNVEREALKKALRADLV